MSKIIDFLDRLVDKLHKCENNAEIYSVMTETSCGGTIVRTHIEYRCAICGKIL